MVTVDIFMQIYVSIVYSGCHTWYIKNKFLYILIKSREGVLIKQNTLVFG